MLNRKEFIKTSSVALACLAGGCVNDRSYEKVVKSIRFEMIHIKASIENRLKLAKLAGFDAIEVNSQGYERTEMQKALKSTEMKVVSVYHSDNWSRSISSLNERERQSAVSSVLASIETAELYGADFVQLLPGKEVEAFGVDGKMSLLKSLQTIAASHSGRVKILLQNFPGENFNSPEALDSVLSKFSSLSIGICLDTEIAQKNGELKNWTSLLEKYFSKVDLDEGNFENAGSLLVDTQKLCCLSLDVSGGGVERIGSLSSEVCVS